MVYLRHGVFGAAAAGSLDSKRRDAKVCVYVRIWDTDLDIPQQRWAGRWRTGRGRAYHGRADQQTDKARRIFSDVNNGDRSLDMRKYNTTAQEGVYRWRWYRCEYLSSRFGFLQQSEAAVAGQGRGGRGKSRSVRRECGGMMSLALHTRLHLDRRRKNAAFPRFRACPPPSCFGGRGVTRAIPMPTAANGRAPCIG